MRKRGSLEADRADVCGKRQRTFYEVPPFEAVLSSGHLHSLTVFNQDLRQARCGLQSFKQLLDDILASNDESHLKLDLLEQYLNRVAPKNPKEDAVYLQDIMETWSFADEANDEGILSSVAVVLSLLLRVVSSSLSLLRHGLGVCQTLLQARQLQSIAKNLSSAKEKAFLISPTLRLLREAVCLDGGAYATRIIRAKSHTFCCLPRNLGLGDMCEEPEHSRKLSVRTNAVRFFLTCLKFAHCEGKRELLLQKELFSRLTFQFKNDPKYLIIEIMDALKSDVLSDERIPRWIKSRIFNAKTLLRFSGLYTQTACFEYLDEKDLVSEKTHTFLVYACTTPVAGIVRPSKGLYPDDFNLSESHSGSRADDANSVCPDSTVAVPNYALSQFAQQLRPWSNSKHCELLVAIFGVAPELVSEYFRHNQSFSFDPKLSMTWIGYAAFLFEIINLPLPTCFGDPVRFADSPPPTGPLLDNILPPAINQKILVRCFSHDSRLISFFATRLLVAALEKLVIALAMHKQTSSKSRVIGWSRATDHLADAFCHKIPEMKEVVRCYRALPAESQLHRTLISRLLRLYYEVIPRVALAARFDVSAPYLLILENMHGIKSESGAGALCRTELESLIHIASYSPGMRWFVKIEGLGSDVHLSAFAASIRLICCDHEGTHHHLRKALTHVAVEHHLVSDVAGLEPLIGALRCCVHQFGPSRVGPIYSFLDNCINRCAAIPIKYLQQMKRCATKRSLMASIHPPSLLTLALLEQLKYATSPGRYDSATPVAEFLSFYLTACHKWERCSPTLEMLRRDASGLLASINVELPRSSGFSDTGKLEVVQHLSGRRTHTCPASDENGAGLHTINLHELMHVSPLDGDNPAPLTGFLSKRVVDLSDDALIASLLRLLLADHINIRKEALTSILKVAARIKESAREYNIQTWLLLSELAESSKEHVDLRPVPTAFVAFALHALEVLRSPVHSLFSKVNSFLTCNPVWPPGKLPLAHDVLHGAPSEDDYYGTELAWLLDYLLSGLRTHADLGVFHHRRLFEKILTFGSNLNLGFGLHLKILKIVYRAACIEAGSTTLATRFGVLSWLGARWAWCRAASSQTSTYCALTRSVWEACDQARVGKWSVYCIERSLIWNLGPKGQERMHEFV